MSFNLRRLTDGVLPQAFITGALSFAHIHDLALKYGQTGWKAWTYPLSVDLLTVAAYRKLVAAHRAKGPTFLPWVCFLLALGASLSANIIATGGRSPLGVAVGVWPAVAFLGCTLLGHSEESAVSVEPTEPEEPAPAPMQPVVPATPVQITNQVAVMALPATPAEAPSVAPALLDWARTVADEYERVNGEPIDTVTLRTKLRISEPLAQTIRMHLFA